MSQSLPFDEIIFSRNVCSEDLLKTPDDSDIGYLLETDLRYLHSIIQKKQNNSFLFL